GQHGHVTSPQRISPGGSRRYDRASLLVDCLVRLFVVPHGEADAVRLQGLGDVHDELLALRLGQARGGFGWNLGRSLDLALIGDRGVGRLLGHGTILPEGTLRSTSAWLRRVFAPTLVFARKRVSGTLHP